MILTPQNDPFFYDTLHQNPMRVNQKSQFYVVRHDSLLLENVSEDEMFDYVNSGELEVLENLWQEDQQT